MFFRKKIKLLKEKVELLKKKLKCGTLMYKICENYCLRKATVYDMKQRKKKNLKFHTVIPRSKQIFEEY